jgi:hypothetical protein
MERNVRFWLFCHTEERIIVSPDYHHRQNYFSFPTVQTMFGWINDCTECLVISKFGEGKRYWSLQARRRF